MTNCTKLDKIVNNVYTKPNQPPKKTKISTNFKRLRYQVKYNWQTNTILELESYQNLVQSL